MGHFVSQPLRSRAAAGVAQKIENIDQARTGNDALIADVAEAGVQIVEELNFQLIARREIPVPAFAGEDVMLACRPNTFRLLPARFRRRSRPDCRRAVP